MPKKADMHEAKGVGHAAFPCEVMIEYPVLAGFLMDTAYEDDPKSKREVSSMFLKYDSGELHCTFIDQATNQQIRVSVASWGLLLPALELLLTSNAAPWVSRKPYKGK